MFSRTMQEIRMPCRCGQFCMWKGKVIEDDRGQDRIK